MQFNTGIYQIVNLVNGKRYIGSASFLRERKNTHWRNLRNENHPNRHLQNAYNKHGRGNFQFEIIMHCSKEHLIFFEQIHIDKYNFEKELYNLAPNAKNITGMKFPNKPKRGPMRQETKNKISIANKGKKKSKTHVLNIKKAKLKFKNPAYIHFSEQELMEINNMYNNNYTQSQIAKKFNCAHSTIGLRLKEMNKNKNANKIRVGERDRIWFTQDELLKMKQMREDGWSYRTISKYFQCSRCVIMDRLKKIM